ncbi:MAG: hypothetical protein P0Y49_04655 [Candidatus Pedobacter colombiensis]|uniref:Uncharacterized protein n=1 Tax=Candidatus Pedobacter colombiensis TaxID=3121371 RepID=A0AAJ5WAL3_9SPHI|nr:hypothetical protein [Pedobacter sp.]WEK20428.1 MAG: hypothetical protein P0Y49_04655 [Pedobacter sp.]
MLFPFTMQQFLIAAVLLSLVWYAGVFLWFNRRRGLGLQLGGTGGSRARAGSEAKARTKLRAALPGRGSGVVMGQEDFDEAELMGKVKLPEGMELIRSDELRFADSVEGASAAGGQGLLDRDDQLGLIPDVLEEIKEVFGILAKEDGTKQDFMGLMKLVREKYPKISSHPGIAGLNAFIRDHAPFAISSAELEDLWD